MLTTPLIKHASASQIGNLLDFGGDRHHMCGMLNSWMGGCRHPEKCNALGAPEVSLGAIIADLGLNGLAEIGSP